MPSFTIGTNDKPSSRSLNDLHPELVARCNAIFAAYAKKFPNAPQPFVDETYRNPADQAADYAKGRTAPGQVVTDAKPSQSLHNYYPSLAFDVAFKDASGKVDWSAQDFSNLGAMAPQFDLNCGISWKTFKDRPHFQPANGGMMYRWEAAQAGTEPLWSAYSQPSPYSA